MKCEIQTAIPVGGNKDERQRQQYHWQESALDRLHGNNIHTHTRRHITKMCVLRGAGIQKGRIPLHSDTIRERDRQCNGIPSSLYLAVAEICRKDIGGMGD